MISFTEIFKEGEPLSVKPFCDETWFLQKDDIDYIRDILMESEENFKRYKIFLENKQPYYFVFPNPDVINNLRFYILWFAETQIWGTFKELHFDRLVDDANYLATATFVLMKWENKKISYSVLDVLRTINSLWIECLGRMGVHPLVISSKTQDLATIDSIVFANTTSNNKT